jgi:hypothetical protein
VSIILTYAFTHISIKYNLDVPKKILKEVLNTLPLDLEIVSFEIQHKKL